MALPHLVGVLTHPLHCSAKGRYRNDNGRWPVKVRNFPVATDPER
jgi:hypothetical protein